MNKRTIYDENTQNTKNTCTHTQITSYNSLCLLTAETKLLRKLSNIIWKMQRSLQCMEWTYTRRKYVLFCVKVSGKDYG